MILRRTVISVFIVGLTSSVSGATMVVAPGAMAAYVATSSLAAFTLVAPTSEVPSGLLARAVIASGAGCPVLRGSTEAGTDFNLPMNLRPKPALAGAAYAAVEVCERGIPAGASTAMVGSRVIPASLPSRIDRIALTGDSGCQVNSSVVQDCSNTSSWPLARINRNIAKNAPDVIINLGDYLYRESVCPPNDQNLCASSPPPPGNLPVSGSAASWIADALTPMQPVFDAAPILMVRGNHESCARGGIGFFLFFSPQRSTALQCAPSIVGGVVVVPSNDITPTWHVTWQVGTSDADSHSLTLEVVDSAYGHDGAVSAFAATQRTSYVAAENHVAKSRPDEAWLLTHRPIFGMLPTQFFPNGGSVWSSADQAAASQGLLGRYGLILSSHIHVAQAVNIPRQPGQIVLGNGATELYPKTGYPTPTYGPLSQPDGSALSPLATPYPAPTSTWTDVRFGYAIATPGRDAKSWSFEHQDDRGRIFAECAVARRAVNCQSTD